jgi:hypothetical protein
MPTAHSQKRQHNQLKGGTQSTQIDDWSGLKFIDSGWLHDASWYNTRQGMPLSSLIPCGPTDDAYK